MDARLHAEEVKLEAGLAPPPIYSTTGRRLQVASGTVGKDGGGSQPTSRSTQHKFVNIFKSPHHRGEDKTAHAPQPNNSGNTGSVAEEEFPCVDMYGFHVTIGEKAAEGLQRAKESQTSSGIKKWENVILHWADTPFGTKKRYCREGIPQPLRARVWQLLLGTLGVKYRHSYQGVYAKSRDAPLASSIADVIERDLPRTFPTNRMFKGDATSPGQASLRNILRAYAGFNPLVGYCQGMAFLASTLLVQIEDEESTFWSFCALMEDKRYNLKRLYEAGFPQLHCCFYVLENLLKKHDRSLYDRMQQDRIDSSFYATHWFLTLFSYCLNFSLISRIWDMFLCEGWKPIYRIALAFLHLERKHLLAQKTDSDLLMALKTVQEWKNPEKLLQTALGIKFKTGYVNKLTQRYATQ